MYYLLETGMFKGRHEGMLIECLERFELEYEWVNTFPFITTIDFKTDRKDVICFGSVKLGIIAKQYNWFPGSFYNENHDYEVYSKYYKENLLNYDSLIINIKDDFEFKDDLFFARPCGDNKAFTGQIYNKDEWNIVKAKLIHNGKAQKFDDINIQISSIKDIQQEFRCWIVNGKCITISQYLLGSNVLYKNYDNDEYILEFVDRMIAIYQPAKAFVMDVCFTDDGIKIIEINSLNMAGFYDCNMQKLIGSLEENFPI